MTNVTGSVVDQAASSLVTIFVPKDHMEQKFKDYWEQVKDLVDESVIRESNKGGYRDVSMTRVAKVSGGTAQFFKPVLADAVQEYLNTQGRQALTITDVDILNKPDGYSVQGLVFLEPTVTWKKDSIPGINTTLVVKIPKPVDNIETLLVEDKVRRDQEDHAILVPESETTVVADNHVILVDCESLLADGSKWEAGSFTNNKWNVHPQTIKVTALYNAVLGMKAGESKKLAFTLDEKFENVGMKDQIINATFKIHQIYKKDTPALDDDLAKSCGYQDFAAYKEAITNAIKTQLEDQRKRLIDYHILATLSNPEVVTVGPVPHVWMSAKANEIYKQQRSMVKTEEELLARFQGATLSNGMEVNNKDTALRYIAERTTQSLVQSLILRDWGKMAEIPGNRKLDAVNEYLPTVQEELLKRLRIEEYDPQSKAEVVSETDKKD